MARVFFTDDATEDLREIKQHVKKVWGKDAWDKEYKTLKAVTASIAQFPTNGSVPAMLSAVGMTDYRQSLTDRNRIFYYFDQNNDSVYIWMILPDMRDYPAHLFRRMTRPPTVKKSSVSVPLTR